MNSKTGSKTDGTFAQIVGRSAFLLGLASAAFTIPAIVRTKFSAVTFGESGIALFGQLSQMQALLISVGAAGLVTATRVILARQSYSRAQASSVLSWCIWVPFAATCCIVGAVAVLASSISKLLLGSSEYGPEVMFAAFGIPFAVAAQVAIAGAQARGSRKLLVLAAGGAALVGSATVSLLMITNNQTIASLSFVAAPAIQFLFVAIVCKPVRESLFVRPHLTRDAFRELAMIAWASAFLAICASLAELMSRTLIVQVHGLQALAAYQPVATVVTQLLSLALSALATAALVELSTVKDLTRLGHIVSNLERKFIPIVGIMAALLLAFSPLVVSGFFSPALWDAAYPLMAVALAFEPTRAAVWLAGSVFLPNGMRVHWLLIGLLSVLAQVGVVFAFANQFGAISLSVGFSIANTLALGVTLAALRFRGILVPKSTVVVPLLLASAILASSFWNEKFVGSIVGGPLICAIVLSLTVISTRISRKPRVGLGMVGESLVEAPKRTAGVYGAHDNKSTIG